MIAFPRRIGARGRPSLYRILGLLLLYGYGLRFGPGPCAAALTKSQAYVMPPPIMAWTFGSATDAEAWIAANPGAHGLTIDRGRLKGIAIGADAGLLSPR